MSDETLYIKEEEIIQTAENFLADESLQDKIPSNDYNILLKNYKKLFKNMKRLVKMSDRQQAEVTTMNTKLQALSKKLSRYLPFQIYDSIFSGKQDVKIESQRKKLTVFFSDIVSFTETTEQLASEELTKLLNYYLHEMFTIAVKHGGTIDKSIGDAILIFFGDPESKGVKEDASACVYMAMDMRKKLGEMQKSLFELGVSKPFKARMGISNGYCTVGNFGSEHRMDYTIIGGFVNLASRLESNASTDQILITHETYALIKDEIFCEKKDTIYVKGIAYPIHTYEVVDFYENLKERSEHTENFDGFSIYMDLDMLQGEKKQKARKKLVMAMDMLKPDDDSS